MKTSLIIILFCILAGGLNAQNLKSFKADTAFEVVLLKPKNIKIDETAPMQGHFYFDINDKYMKETCKLYEEIFGDMDEETKTALFRGASVTFFFDKNLHIYYYYYSFSQRYSPILLKLEDQFAEFIEKYQKIDLASYIQIDDRTAFKSAIIKFYFASVINYEKYPERFRGDRYYY